MLGAIIGDLAGSIYEYEQINKIKKIKINNIIENDAFFSDDTILTVAIANAILNQTSYEDSLKNYASNYADKIPTDRPYFEKMFSTGFLNWVQGKSNGISTGNGAMMRISPVGFLFNSEDEIIKQVQQATIPSHNSEEAITNATTIALIIFYARKGLSKKEIIKKLHLKIKKPKIDHFNYFCIDTIDVCLYSLFKSKNFEDSLKIAISFGGDTDTNACIVGSMAEALYGIDENLKKQALSKLPADFIEIITKFYNTIVNIKE